EGKSRRGSRKSSARRPPSAQPTYAYQAPLSAAANVSGSPTSMETGRCVGMNAITMSPPSAINLNVVNSRCDPAPARTPIQFKPGARKAGPIPGGPPNPAFLGHADQGAEDLADDRAAGRLRRRIARRERDPSVEKCRELAESGAHVGIGPARLGNPNREIG